MKRRIIGIYSPNPQSGKTVARKILEEHGFVHLSFATPVKESLLVVLKSLGVFRPEKYLWGNWKDKRIPELGVTGGYLMSSYATRFMRDMIGEDVWLDALINQVYKTEPKDVVIDDLRFPNEYNWIKRVGGETIKIIRPSVMAHDRLKRSEGQLEGYRFDWTILNDGSLEGFDYKVAQILGLCL